MNLVLLGAPGSGKGTQGNILGDYYNVEKISLGDILREEKSKGSELGDKVRKYMEEGTLVPDEIIKQVMTNKIDNDGFLIDGFPRNLNQAKMLEEILNNKNMSLDKVVYLDVNEETVVKRLTGRRICSGCGALYHVVNMPPKEDNKCDQCGQELTMRKDDNKETVCKRLQVFNKQTHALIDYYEQKGLLLKVDGNSEKDAVFEEIKKKLKDT